MNRLLQYYWLVFLSITTLNSQHSPIPIIPDGTAAGVQSPSCGAVEPPIAGLAEELEEDKPNLKCQDPQQCCSEGWPLGEQHY